MATNATHPKYILPLADPGATLEVVGGKGASLARLVRAGLEVPGGFHITTAAYRQFVEENNLQSRILEILKTADPDQPATLEAASAQIRRLFTAGQIPDDIATAIEAAYNTLADGNAPTPVAVRSSATAEDLPDASFAGQQETFLNIQGTAKVVEAVKRCWASLWTARATGYRARQGIDHNNVSLAIVVQKLVPADTAGILFTANPMTGRRDQAIISAAWGLGEAIVGGLVTPDTVIVDKATGQVQERETASKQVMTVRVDGGTEEQPVPQELRDTPVLNDQQAAELTQLGLQIEELYGMPVDIEWALTGGTFTILQARPITALPEPELPPPTGWKLPGGAYLAMRNNIVELMAEPLTPLFSTLGRDAINTSMRRLLNDFFGKPGIVPEELIITVNQYAYYNGSFSLLQIGRILLNSIGIMRRMFTGAVERWTDAGRPHYVSTVERWQKEDWHDLTTTEILGAARELSEAAIDAYGALVSGVIPAAWISEGLFTAVYNTLLKRRDDPPARTYLLGFNSAPILAEKSLYDLAEWARTEESLTTYLLRTPADQIAIQNTQTPAGVEEENWHEWQNRFQAHLRHYGHTIYNLDFANPVPADDPTPLLEVLKLYLAGQGTNPHTRQQAAEEAREQATQTMLNRLKGLRRKLFIRFSTTAKKYAPLREDGLADVGLSYPLLRQMLREVGRRFAGEGIITEPDGIFWLTQEEVAQAAARLDQGEALDKLSATIPQRKAVWRAARRASPPVMLPQVKFLDKKRKQGRRGKDNVLKGVAASPGTVTATARVLHGPEDFSQMQPGDVLVAAITTPAWTPLFAMASAVVTDVGGPLSHGSIVAREYGIPAVLGTGDATRRIKSGQTVIVNGEQGTVEMLPQGPPSIAWPLPDPKGKYVRTSIVELLPDPLTPLFSTLGRAAINTGTKRLMAELGGIKEGWIDETVVTINDYAYYTTSFPLMATIKLAFVAPFSMSRMMRQAETHWRDVIHVSYAGTIQRWQARPLHELQATEILTGVRQIMEKAFDVYAWFQSAMFAKANMSEMVFTAAYDRLLKTEDDPPALTYLLGANTTPIRAEQSLYDIAEWCRTRPAIAAYLAQTPAPELVEQLKGPPPQDIEAEDWQQWQVHWDKYLQQFGHIIYDFDFSKPVPADNPAPLLDTCKMFFNDQLSNPYIRQQTAIERREQATQAMLEHLKGLKLKLFRKLVTWAQESVPLREEGLADLGFGYPHLRKMLLELGRRLVEAGAIEQPDDIFWLVEDEAQQAARALDSNGDIDNTLASTVAERKDRWNKERRLVPPAILPPKSKWMGVDLSAFVATEDSGEETGTIRGAGTSPGTATGVARVLYGPEDFDQVQPGDILVAPITTPAWTPLFTRAAAVVTDIGGQLSHGSIVAREYGIPAVMGTGVATQRIQSGQVITVDGDKGTVEINF